MVLKLILYLSFITFSLCILCYEGMARKLGYRFGRKTGNIFQSVGGVLFIAGVIECFFVFYWWMVIIGIFLSVFLGAQFTIIFRDKTQLLAPLFVLLSIIGIIIYQSF